jgi:hypothetical protein
MLDQQSMVYAILDKTREGNTIMEHFQLYPNNKYLSPGIREETQKQRKKQFLEAAGLSTSTTSKGDTAAGVDNQAELYSTSSTNIGPDVITSSSDNPMQLSADTLKQRRAMLRQCAPGTGLFCNEIEVPIRDKFVEPTSTSTKEPDGAFTLCSPSRRRGHAMRPVTHCMTVPGLWYVSSTTTYRVSRQHRSTSSYWDIKTDSSSDEESCRHDHGRQRRPADTSRSKEKVIPGQLEVSRIVDKELRGDVKARCQAEAGKLLGELEKTQKQLEQKDNQKGINWIIDRQEEMLTKIWDKIEELGGEKEDIVKLQIMQDIVMDLKKMWNGLQTVQSGEQRGDTELEECFEQLRGVIDYHKQLGQRWKESGDRYDPKEVRRNYEGAREWIFWATNQRQIILGEGLNTAALAQMTFGREREEHKEKLEEIKDTIKIKLNRLGNIIIQQGTARSQDTAYPIPPAPEQVPNPDQLNPDSLKIWVNQKLEQFTSMSGKTIWTWQPLRNSWQTLELRTINEIQKDLYEYIDFLQKVTERGRNVSPEIKKVVNSILALEEQFRHEYNSTQKLLEQTQAHFEQQKQYIKKQACEMKINLYQEMYGLTTALSKNQAIQLIMITGCLAYMEDMGTVNHDRLAAALEALRISKNSIKNQRGQANVTQIPEIFHHKLGLREMTQFDLMAKGLLAQLDLARKEANKLPQDLKNVKEIQESIDQMKRDITAKVQDIEIKVKRSGYISEQLKTNIQVEIDNLNQNMDTIQSCFDSIQTCARELPRRLDEADKVFQKQVSIPLSHLLKEINVLTSQANESPIIKQQQQEICDSIKAVEGEMRQNLRDMAADGNYTITMIQYASDRINVTTSQIMLLMQQQKNKEEIDATQRVDAWMDQVLLTTKNTQVQSESPKRPIEPTNQSGSTKNQIENVKVVKQVFSDLPPWAKTIYEQCVREELWVKLRSSVIDRSKQAQPHDEYSEDITKTWRTDMKNVIRIEQSKMFAKIQKMVQEGCDKEIVETNIQNLVKEVVRKINGCHAKTWVEAKRANPALALNALLDEVSSHDSMEGVETMSLWTEAAGFQFPQDLNADLTFLSEKVTSNRRSTEDIETMSTISNPDVPKNPVQNKITDRKILE